MERVNPFKAAPLPSQTSTATFPPAHFPAHFHAAPYPNNLPRHLSHGSKPPLPGPRSHGQHHQNHHQPQHPTVAQRIYQRLLETSLTALPHPPCHPNYDASPIEVPNQEHLLRARALTRRLQEAISLDDPDPDEEEMTDGAEDVTPSPPPVPDHRDWGAVKGRDRAGSVKRGAGEAVDGARMVKKVRGGGGGVGGRRV